MGTYAAKRYDLVDSTNEWEWGPIRRSHTALFCFFLNVVGKRWKSYHLMQNVSSPQRMCCWVRKGVVSESKGCGFPIAV